jgi:hypothetical protein
MPVTGLILPQGAASAMTIDTLKYVKKLEAAGVDRKQAEAHAAAIRGTLATRRATKADLDRLEQKFDARFLLLQWMWALTCC